MNLETPRGGYDGEYGVIKIFKEGELARLTGQMYLPGKAKVIKKQSKPEQMRLF